jgi:hypothetical protein
MAQPPCEDNQTRSCEFGQTDEPIMLCVLLRFFIIYDIESYHQTKTPRHRRHMKGVMHPILWCVARFEGLSLWFVPARRGGGGGGVPFAPRPLHLSTPCHSQKLLLTSVSLSSEKDIVPWSLSQAAGESQNAVPHCLASCDLRIPRPYLRTFEIVCIGARAWWAL